MSLTWLTPPMLPPTSLESSVRDRYAAAAEEREAALCCPVSYDPEFLKIIPQEILEKDYGCGDPSRHLVAGETVLDLGSGGGKICYIAAQIVGPSGFVIGIDFNEPMLGLARKHQPTIAAALGYSNVEFRRGRIQDLQLDLDRLDELLVGEPIRTSHDWLAAEPKLAHLRASRPLVASATVDVVVSNCVLNLVQQSDREQLFDEVFRVLKPGGRAVISDIVSSADVPESLQRDPLLWSGCVSGAFREDLFGRAFEEAGFVGIEVLTRQSEPWQVIDGIDFRSLTIRAWKPLAVEHDNQSHEVIYRGPWAAVIDDSGTELLRGERTFLTDTQRAQLALPPYRLHLEWLTGQPGPVGSCCTPVPLDLLPVQDTGCCSSGTCC